MAVDGTWTSTLQTPVGPQPVTLNIATDGSTISGNMTSDMGTDDITSGTVDGDDVSFVVDFKQPMAMQLEFSAKLEGDKMTGQVVLGFMGPQDFEATRG
jgi:hypothetical protein